MMIKDYNNGFKNPVAYKVGAVYSGLFMFVGAALPFWALWLSKMGLTPGEIGFLIGFPAFLKVLSAPFVAQLCDKWGMTRRPMMGLMALSVIFFCGYFFTRSFKAFVLVTLVFSVTYYSVSPLVESYAVRTCDRYNLQYGRLRSVGSIVFVFTSVLFGIYLDRSGYDNFLYFCLGSLVLTFIAIFLLPKDGRKFPAPVSESIKNDSAPAIRGQSPLRFLLTSQQFIMFLVVISLIQMSHGFMYVMGSYHWAAQGINNETIGLLWSIGVVAEILVFIFAGKIITRIRPMYILGVIAIFGTVRWGVMALTSSVPLLMFLQTFHGLTYGAAHLVAMYYLSTRVPDQYFTTAQSLYSSIPMGLSIGVVMLLSGPLYDGFGGQAYFFMAGLCFLVLFVARYVRRIDHDVLRIK